jgi:penicillin-binding protein 1B
MKRAHKHSQYRDVHRFEAPSGIVWTDVDAETGEVATPRCPTHRTEVFIAGTQPVEVCHLHGAGATQVASWDPAQSEAPVVSERPTGGSAGVAAARAQERKSPRSILITPQPAPPQPEKKKGILERLKNIFR